MKFSLFHKYFTWEIKPGEFVIGNTWISKCFTPKPRGSKGKLLSTAEKQPTARKSERKRRKNTANTFISITDEKHLQDTTFLQFERKEKLSKRSPAKPRAQDTKT